MGGAPSRNRKLKTTQDGGTNTETANRVHRTLDGKKKGMKIRTGTMKAKWMEEMPEIGGFQMTTRNIHEPDGRKGYGLGINTKQLNLATFEIEVLKDGNIVLTGRKLKNSNEGQLKLITLPDVQPGDIRVDALDDNRTIWIRIYYETPEKAQKLLSIPENPFPNETLKKTVTDGIDENPKDCKESLPPANILDENIRSLGIQFQDLHCGNIPGTSKVVFIRLWTFKLVFFWFVLIFKRKFEVSSASGIFCKLAHIPKSRNILVSRLLSLSDRLNLLCWKNATWFWGNNSIIPDAERANSS
ncbi:unnamed protein product [Allacma fusca]|uniref:Uncharacterized protein n=1 Tax=Allacma fusca TaxID=39272 RepID=A0A8J2P077_9HEXA|nr:unnamed protein product [Allacma fusca]